MYRISISQRPRDLAEEERALRAAAHEAVVHGQDQVAAALLERLEITQPDEPRWPHQRGDALSKLGALEESSEAYERAASLYERLGFESRARRVRGLGQARPA
jgi:hypothetical protein